MLPNLLLLGAQKSASTLLGLWVSKHPQIYVRTKEDRSFEDPEYSSFDPVFLSKDLPEGIKYYGIRRPEYLAVKKYTLRLKQHLPDAKVISVLRNPVDRSISAYHHYIKYGHIPVRSYDDFFVKRKFRNSIEKNVYKQIINFSLYYGQVKRLFELFGRKNVLILLHEEILEGSTVFQKICEFLKIDIVDIPKPTGKPQEAIYNFTRLRIHNIRAKTVHTFNEDGTKYYSIPWKDRSIFTKLLDYLLMKSDKILFSKLYGNRPPKINGKVRFELTNLFKQDINNLEDLIDRNLTRWRGSGSKDAY